MGRSKLSPAQKRAITTLRNSGIVVSFQPSTVSKAVTATPAAAPALKGKVVCTEITCYKVGHAFSKVGAFGNGTAKGHFDLNPSHGYKEI